MTLLTEFRQLHVTDITLNQAVLLEFQFRGGLNPFVKGNHQRFQFCEIARLVQHCLKLNIPNIFTGTNSHQIIITL